MNNDHKIKLSDDQYNQIVSLGNAWRKLAYSKLSTARDYIKYILNVSTILISASRNHEEGNNVRDWASRKISSAFTVSNSNGVMKPKRILEQLTYRESNMHTLGLIVTLTLALRNKETAHLNAISE
jgi:hypothetical protein